MPEPAPRTLTGGPPRPPPSSTKTHAWKGPPRTSRPSSVFPTFARRVALETPTSSLFCDEPLILTEPPGPCGAGRFCRLWRRWCSGRRRARPPARKATREPKGSEWSISKPARALRSLRRPPHLRRVVCRCAQRRPPRPRRWSLRPERIGLRLRNLALHSRVASAKIVVSTPTWRVIRPPVR